MITRTHSLKRLASIGLVLMCGAALASCGGGGGGSRPVAGGSGDQMLIMPPSERPPAPIVIVSSPAVSSSRPAAGASFTLSATVSNTGDGEAAGTTLRYYRSTDATITTADTAEGTDAVAKLTASGSSSKSVDLTAPASPGVYYYGACVDPVAGESAMTNNCSPAVQVRVSGPEGRPDLIVGSPAVSNSRPAVGASFTLSATVSNTGDGEAAATMLRYYRSTDATITTADTAEGTDAVGTLSASGSSAESISLTAPATAGTYYYGACVDAVAGESDTTNNCSPVVQVTVLQRAEQGQGQPDLGVGAPSLSDSSPTTGESFTLSATVSNTGDGEAAATTLRYYRSTDATITTADTAEGTDAVGTLSASGSSAESISLTAPATAGTYYYGACVDAVAGESDTTNNCSASVRVDVEAPMYPDLSVGVPSLSDSSPTTGESFTLSATVSNTGDGEAAATTLRYYRSTDATITTADTAEGTDAVGTLSASGSSAESISLTAPATAGTYYYGACVDAVAGESDTTNNCSPVVSVTVLQTALQKQGQPDLEVGTPTVNTTRPATGASFTLSATVSNAGDGEAAATTLRYYRSTDATITTADTAEGTDAVGTLSASGSSAESISLTAPATAGAYYYGACVDAVTDESDTTNNCSASVKVDVGAPPVDLRVGSTTVDLSNPVTGETFTLSVQVFNAIRGETAATTLRYYRSTDATITTADTAVGTDAVGVLSAYGHSDESISLTAPSTAGAYYYGACVDAVAGESDTTNNCSASVKVDVQALGRRVDISPRTLTFDALGGSKTVTVRILDENGEEVSDASFVWISFGSPNLCCTFARTDGGIKVTANAAGRSSAQISEFNASSTRSIRLHVTVYQTPTSMEVSPNSASLAVDETTTLTATIKDANGNSIHVDQDDGRGGLVVYWESSDATVATVEGSDSDATETDNTGATATVTAVGAGSATITGRWGGRITGTATVTVTN